MASLADQLPALIGVGDRGRSYVRCDLRDRPGALAARAVSPMGREEGRCLR